jgi:site-specific recombinase XerD
VRHLAAYRMTRDPGMPLADVQWVLGHAQLATTQLLIRRSSASFDADERATSAIHPARRTKIR